MCWIKAVMEDGSELLCYALMGISEARTLVLGVSNSWQGSVT